MNVCVVSDNIRILSIFSLLLCTLEPVSSVLHEEVVLGVLILLGLMEAGQGVAVAASATSQLVAFLRRLTSLTVWPFHAAVLALAFLGLSAHEHAPAKKIVPVCATCSGAGSSGCGSGGGGCGASGGGKCGCGGGKAVAGNPPAGPAVQISRPASVVRDGLTTGGAAPGQSRVQSSRSVPAASAPGARPAAGAAPRALPMPPAGAVLPVPVQRPAGVVTPLVTPLPRPPTAAPKSSAEAPPAGPSVPDAKQGVEQPATEGKP